MRRAQRRPLRFCLLHAVLSEHALAGGDHWFDRLRRKSLRHRDERDRGGIAPRLGACGRDLVANLGKRLGAVRFSDRFHHTRSYHPFASLRSLAAAWVLAQSGELKPGNAVTAIYARPTWAGSTPLTPGSACSSRWC